MPAPDPAALRAAANAAAARRDWEAAIAGFAGLTAATPSDPAAWLALAKACDAGGRVAGAADAARRALALAPPSFAHALLLARLLRSQHDTAGLRTLAAQWRPRLAALPAADLVAFADLLGREDAHADALPVLDAALAADPSAAPAWYLRGTTRLFLGDFEGARDDLQRAIALVPHFAHAHWRLSELRGHFRADAGARIARLRHEHARTVAGSEHDVHFGYALFAELHDVGEHAEAWAALQRGMRAKRAMFAYDVAADVALAHDIARRHGRGFVEADPRSAAGGAADAPRPVFIIGLFRSGTTVVERLLAGHPQVADGGESAGFVAALRRAIDHRGNELVDATVLDRAAALDFAALGATFVTENAWRARGRAVWTEKLPSNFLLAGLIARALPQARFVHVHRPPMDVCFANLRTLYGGIAKYSYDQREMAAWHHAYAALMAHWRDVLGDRLLDLDHGALLHAPETQARRLLAHAGLAWTPAVLALDAGGAVSTASAAQVRGGLRAPAPPDWLPYRDALAPLADALARDA